jgi:hypothetical protein
MKPLREGRAVLAFKVVCGSQLAENASRLYFYRGDLRADHPMTKYTGDRIANTSRGSRRFAIKYPMVPPWQFAPHECTSGYGARAYHWKSGLRRRLAEIGKFCFKGSATHVL